MTQLAFRVNIHDQQKGKQLNRPQLTSILELAWWVTGRRFRSGKMAC